MAVHEIEDKDQLRRTRKQRRDGDEPVHRHQRNEEIICERRVTADIPCQPQIVKRHEDGIGPDQRQEEMPFAQCFVHHASRHLGEPEIRSGKYTHDGGYAHHHVEMPDNEIGGVEIDVDRRLREKESADSSAHEHRNESNAEQGRAIDSQIRSVQTAQPDQRHDRGRNRDHQRWEGKDQRGERIHAAEKHVMSPDHVAEEPDPHHAVDNAPLAQHRLAHVADQDVADDTDRRQDRDVYLRMSEEPEQVLPQTVAILPDGLANDR